jgi:vacuolar protein sorting-associated protein 13A/C
METVLVKFLGKYVDGIKSNLDVSILTGDVSLEKISIRPEFINELGLPFVLKYSHVSKIIINVPWTNLKEKPTTVTVQGIYVLLALKYDDIEDMDTDPSAKLKLIVDRAKQEIKKKWEEKEVAKDTFAEKSIIKIIDNLVLNIGEIHVRVESMKRNWDFSFGVVIDKMTSCTVDENEKKMFYTRHFNNKEENKPLRKLLSCERFEMYFNDKEEFFMSLEQGKDSNEKIRALLAEPFAASASPTGSPNKRPSMIKSVSLKESYKMKTFSSFTFNFVIEQKLSADKKYVV